MKNHAEQAREHRGLLGLTLAIAAINLAGTAAVLLTGGMGIAAPGGSWLSGALAGLGHFFYTWWWIMLPASAIGCMLLWDLREPIGAIPPEPDFEECGKTPARRQRPAAAASTS